MDKQYKPFDVVPVSDDRSSRIDVHAELIKRRDDLSDKWRSQDSCEHEVWEAFAYGRRLLVDRNFPEFESGSEFSIQPDFDNEL